MSANFPLMSVATFIPVSYPVNISSIDSHPNIMPEVSSEAAAAGIFVRSGMIKV